MVSVACCSASARFVLAASSADCADDTADCASEASNVASVSPAVTLSPALTLSVLTVPEVPKVRARESTGCTVPAADVVTVTVPIRTAKVVVFGATPPPLPDAAATPIATPAATTTTAAVATTAVRRRGRRESASLMVRQSAVRASPLPRFHLGTSLKNRGPR